MTSNVVFVDVETTGLDPDRHQIWEIGLIVPGEGLIDPAEYHWFLPVDLGAAELAALNIGRYHDRHPDGHNATTPGEPVTEPALFAAEFAEALAVGYLAGSDENLRPNVRPPWKSDQLTEALGIVVDDMDKHTALGDARWAKALYEAVMGQ